MEEKILNRIEAVLDAPSCYPEYERKSREVRRKELIDWFEKYGEVNESYNLWGMDRVMSQPGDHFLDRCLFRKQRHDINAVYYPAGSRFPYDYTILMRDKFLFETFMRATFGDRNCYCASEGVMIGKNLFVWDLGKSLEKITVEELLRRFDGEKIVCKMSFGFSGAGVRVAEVSGNCITEEGKTYEAEEFFSMLSASNAVWLIQKFIRQHEALKQLNVMSYVSRV